MIDPDALAAVKLRRAGPTRVSRADGTVHLEDGHGKGSRRLLRGQRAPLIEAAPDPDLACVLPGRLYLGSQDAMFNESGVREANIGLVVHLAYCGRPGNLPARVRFLRAPVPDTDREALVPALEERGVLEAMDGAEEGRAVLVTCNAGVSRGASAVIAYLILRRGMTYEEAHRATRSARPQIRVSNFEEELRSLVPCAPKK